MKRFPVKDLVGAKFGFLTVISPIYHRNGSRGWLCRCECGNEVVRRTARMKNPRTKHSCQACFLKRRAAQRAEAARRIRERRIRQAAECAARKLTEQPRERTQPKRRPATEYTLIVNDDPRPRFWSLPDPSTPHLAAWDDGEWVSIPLIQGPCGVHPDAQTWCPRCTQVRLDTQFLRRPQAGNITQTSATHPWAMLQPKLPPRIESFRRRVG